MKSRVIPDSAVTASSYHPGHYEPYRARIDDQIEAHSYGCWASRSSEQNIKSVNRRYYHHYNLKISQRKCTPQYLTEIKFDIIISLLTDNIMVRCPKY